MGVAKTVKELRYRPAVDDRISHVPDHMREDMAITSLEDSRLVTDFLRSIITRLKAIPEFHGEAAGALDNIALVVSDSERPASISFIGDKPILSVARSLIDFVESEDEMAYVLFHEVAHSEFRRKLKSMGAAPEEVAADCLGARWANQVGYDWQAPEQLLKRLARARGRWSNDQPRTLID